VLEPQYRAAVDQVRITIVQPRAQHPDGVIRSETITIAELIEFSIELIDAARATQAARRAAQGRQMVPLLPGVGVCPALVRTRRTWRRSSSAWSTCRRPATLPMPPSCCRDPHKLPILEQWIKDMRADAYARSWRGEEVPGFKLVQKRNTRYWLDEKETEQYLTRRGPGDGRDLRPEAQEPRADREARGQEESAEGSRRQEAAGTRWHPRTTFVRRSR
jgi:hypothetical protein